MTSRRSGVAEPGRNCAGIYAADRFGWAIDGAAYFSALRDSFEKAEREILIVGWDIDSRVELVRDPDHPHFPSPLRATLESLVQRRPALEVHVLSWDFAMVYLLERELLPASRFGWQDSERLDFRLDGRHVTGASHHQKLAVIDGRVAFAGGIDITRNRWDTPAHAPDNPMRRDPDGKPYGPFHDVQAVVSGEIAGTLRELVNRRWQNATGKTLPELEAGSNDEPDPWPECIDVAVEDTELALARTWSDPDTGAVTAEVETLYLDLIAAARHSIYVENQYFTSLSIARALKERLLEEDGPEVVLLLPARTSGWLEQSTMDVLRNSVLNMIEDADEHGRLRVMAPVVDELGDTGINVHGKIMVTDLRFVRIGSANLSGRSMGLDSECDLLLDGEASGAGFRLVGELLGEHLGRPADAMTRELEQYGLIGAIERNNDGPRRLEALSYDRGTADALLEPIAKIADLEKPIEKAWSEAFPETGDLFGVSDDIAERAGEARRSPFAWLGAGVVVLFLLGIGGWLATSDAELSAEGILAALEARAAGPFAPFIAAPVFALAATLVAPVTWMIALCALLFDPVVAATVAITGTAVALVATHQIGVMFAGPVAKRLPGKLIARIERLAAGADTLSMAGLRMIPIAPFAIVNVAVGIAGVPLRPFLLGSLLAMVPGILIVCFSIDRARAALRGEPVFDPLVAALIVLAGIGLIALRVLRNRVRDD